jgi:hypothetical protein
MSTRRDVQALITEYKGELVRDRKHLIYRFPDGRTFAISSTPSDYRADANNMARLRKFLGIEREIVKNPGRRDKPGASGHPAWECTARNVKMRNWKRDLYIQTRKLSPRKTA